MQKMIKQKQLFLVIYSVSVVLIALILTFLDTSPKQLKKLLLMEPDDIPYGYVSCHVTLNIDEYYLLNMKVLLPSENRRQNNEISEALPKIKHRIIEKMDRKKAKMIRNGNLASFKKELVGIVNQELKKPVKDLYFQQVNLY